MPKKIPLTSIGGLSSNDFYISCIILKGIAIGVEPCKCDILLVSTVL